MADLGDSFFTSVGCMDGRVQDPVANFGRKMFDVLFADTITDAGLVGLLSNNPPQVLLDSLKNKIGISIEKHHSRGILVHGHENCAALNAATYEKQIEDIKKSVEIVKKLIDNKIPVIGAFVKRSPTNPKIWEVEEV